MSKRSRKSRSLEPVETTIESLSHDGRGIAHINGKITFIDGALPNEKIIFQYTNHHGQFDEGKTTEVLQAAKERIAPACPYYSICGGCNLQHLDHNAQIIHKQEVLLKQLEYFGDVTPREILPPLTGPIWGYRKKARLSIRFVIKKDQLLVGFREKNGRFITDMDCCEILEPSIGKKIEALKTCLRSLEAYMDIPQLEVAIGDERAALIVRHLKELSKNDQDILCRFAEQNQFDLYLQPKGLDSVHKIWPKNTEDRLSYCLDKYQVELLFHPCDFTQVNSTINEQMVERALTLLDLKPTDHVLDLFCGLGNFTIPIAKFCKQVVGIEGNQQMVDRGKENARHNQLNNAFFYKHDLSSPLPHTDWAKEKYQKILLDPPRTGAAEIIAHISTFQPERIVYVSCNPATLARDAKTLVHEHGYRLEKAGIMDMFPHTAHVESIALFVAQ